jgi:Spy/CpxP family protein refolding chaperone
MGPEAKSRRRIIGMLLRLALALPVVSVLPVHAANEAGAGGIPRQQAPRRVAGPNLRDRVSVLTKALNLDPSQQAQLRSVLEDQREAVRRIWSDTTAPAAYRIAATQAIGEKTADRIRAFLNDEQRKKYNPPRPVMQDARANPGQRSVEDWMNATRAKPAQSGSPAPRP